MITQDAFLSKFPAMRKIIFAINSNACSLCPILTSGFHRQISSMLSTPLKMILTKSYAAWKEEDGSVDCSLIYSIKSPPELFLIFFEFGDSRNHIS